MTRDKKQFFKNRKLTQPELRNKILQYFRSQPGKKLNVREVMSRIKTDNNKDQVAEALNRLKETGSILVTDKFKYFLPVREPFAAKEYEGIVDMTMSGAAYVECEGQENDIYVPATMVNGAMHGDKVKVATMFSKRRRPEGKIVSILQRARDRFLGTYYFRNGHGIVVPDRLMPKFDIYIDPEGMKGAKEGDKVVVHVTRWPGKRYKYPTGEITSVLGTLGSSDLEMKIILINQGFDPDFDESVLEESASIPGEITEDEIKKRRDFRGITTCTIDPLTAKDFDDALSIRTLENGNIEVGVHIADVTHYVKEQTLLDKEAYKRSTSVYLVDRVAPMLPERLSNELCSLRPGEDKLTFSAVFEFNDKHKIVNTWLGKTIIHSNRRFTYEEAQEIIESGSGEHATEILRLNDIALSLRKDKFKNGAINFESDEVQFVLDEKGFPTEIYVKERKDAHMLVEDFMLQANKAVARYMSELDKKKPAPFVYRVHDLPDPERLQQFGLFAAEMGVKMDFQTPEKTAKSLNKLTKEAEKNEALKILMPLAIRTMAKAEYSTTNIGHYGLAFEDYSHFTSPIRRYADVLAHRILYRNLTGYFAADKETLELQCKHISKQEKKATDAERESIKYKQVEYMEQFIGREFIGIVSGMIERGFFVELIDNFCEGMVPFDRLDETFVLEENRLKAKGRTSGKLIKMGDRITVRIVAADVHKRQIEMEPVLD